MDNGKLWLWIYGILFIVYAVWAVKKEGSFRGLSYAVLSYVVFLLMVLLYACVGFGFLCLAD